jgi:putative tryptophan/tyrosine transport system substrate-binding protein
MLAVSPAAAQTSRIYRAGWLCYGDSPTGPIDRELIVALAERNFVVERNLQVDFAFAKGDPGQLVPLAKELAARSPDILLGIGGDVLGALRGASDKIPIVGGISDDPIRSGLARSFARPGLNFTGMTFMTDEMAAKRVELIREIVPAMRRLAVLWNPQHLDDEMRFAQQAAASLGLELSSHPAPDHAGVDVALRDVLAARPDGLLVIPSRLMSLAARLIADRARERRLPVVAAWREFVVAGSLASYGPKRALETRRIAALVERVLAGANPVELPIERPTAFELVVNLKTARAIDLRVPAQILDRADETIE